MTQQGKAHGWEGWLWHPSAAAAPGTPLAPAGWMSFDPRGASCLSQAVRLSHLNYPLSLCASVANQLCASVAN
jgi:hypothetical protein